MIECGYVVVAPWAEVDDTTLPIFGCFHLRSNSAQTGRLHRTRRRAVPKLLQAVEAVVAERVVAESRSRDLVMRVTKARSGGGGAVGGHQKRAETDALAWAVAIEQDRRRGRNALPGRKAVAVRCSGNRTTATSDQRYV